MNKIFYCLLIVALAVSCKKGAYIVEDKRCSELIVDDQTINLLPVKEIDTIHYLFTKNHINIPGLLPKSYIYSMGYRYIGAYQFVNGLKVFTNHWSFEFGKNDSLIFMHGDTILSLDLPKMPRLSIAQVRSIFINAINADGFIIYASLQDSCMNMQFGYYDLKAGAYNNVHKYTTAWKINPNNRDYPYAFIDDLNERLIYYDNGIRTWEN